MELRIPVSTAHALTVWAVSITWDMPTTQENIILTSSTPGVVLEKTDFQVCPRKRVNTKYVQEILPHDVI
jgi:hypothetical protein